MNIFADFLKRISSAVQALGLESKSGEPLPFARIGVEPPRDPVHGDIATNAAMVLAKHAGMNPRELASRIVDALKADPDIAAADIAGPGFINLRLSHVFWARFLAGALAEGAAFGRSRIGEGCKVNVEYVSANPTGPIHVGHCRGAVVGDALANLLAFAGYDVTKEYYINDAGAQIDVLGQSVLLRYREALGEEIGEIPSGLYPGDYLVPVGQALAAEHGDALFAMTPAEALKIAKDKAIDAMMDRIRDDLALLNVHHEVFYSERSLHSANGAKIQTAINELTFKGHVYRGKLPPPKGKPSEDWEDREQLLFKSTAVGDDVDRPLVKSDGSYTYFAADVAYFVDKFNRGFDEMIYVLGADHGGYVKRLEALARAVSGDKVRLTALLCNLVKLFRNGEPVRMSKRAGDFVTLREVVEEVGRDPVRFMMLYRKNGEPLDFDFAKVTEQSKDNPVFYVQYACARAHSVIRQAAEQMGIRTLPANADFNLLSDEGELALIAKLAEYPRMIEAAALAQEPHRVAFYLYELASLLHAQWNRGGDNPELRFLKVNDPQSTYARLGLVQAVLNVLTSGLGLVGAAAPQEMR